VFLYAKNGTHVRRIKSDGSQLRDLLSQENLSPQEVSISPDAKEIIVSYFQKDLPGMHLGIMPADGGLLTRIYSHKAVGFAPDWFPTGDKIILTYADFDQRFPHRTPQGDRAKNYMVSMNKDGANMQFISDTLSGLSNDLYPMISPDERKIAFVSLRNYPENIFPEVFLMTIDGANVQQLTECIGCIRHGDHFDMYTMDARPRWTKDGQYIYFNRTAYTYNHDRRAYNQEIRDIYIIKADGTGLQNISNDGISDLLKVKN
jgi:Tol biopolymer transport system component